MAGERILVVEDDNDLSRITRDYLRKEGYRVEVASDGEEGLKKVSIVKPQLIILDIMLPKIDGMEVCRLIRQTLNCPIIVISAKTSDLDKVLSLGLGADDYMTKPFSFVELIARVKSHLRRYTTLGQTMEPSKPAKQFNDLIIDVNSMKVTVKEKEISFTSKEFKLLDYLSDYPSRVFTKEQLMDGVWGYDEFIDDNTIAVYIGRIREKLSKEKVCYIKTVWGVGYKWEI